MSVFFLKKIINHLKLKKTNVHIKENSKKIDLILKLLVKLNIIKYAKILKNNKKITLKLNKNTLNFKSNFSSCKKIFLKKKIIEKITIKKKCFFLISTSNGVMTNIDAIKLNLGGVLIYTILQ